MKAFSCDACGQLIFFENISCLRCGHALGFIPGALDLAALALDGALWRPLAEHSRSRKFRQCENGIRHQVCNWLVEEQDPNPFCIACRLNELIPDLSVAGNRDRWHKLENAKRRAIYTILGLALPMEADLASGKPPLRFQFKAETPSEPVLTGHAEGVITINIAEADDEEREKRRVALHEPYRTLLGHLRHEIAHYYWDRLISGTPRQEPFRELFGDERADYAESLRRHYELGPAVDWSDRCVTAYASSHPWEDWAETWAHYHHILDTTETARAFGISLRPRHPGAASMKADLKQVNGLGSDFQTIYEHWLPLTYALNELNRGMGLQDLYPFVISEKAVLKLQFIHETLRNQNSP